MRRVILLLLVLPLLMGQRTRVMVLQPTVAAAGGGTTIWEDWDCSNHSTVFDCDSNWDETNHHGNGAINTNEFINEGSAGARLGLVNEAGLDSADQWVCGRVRVDISGGDPANDGLAFRLPDSDWDGAGNGGPAYVFRVNGGSSTLAIRYCNKDPASCSDIFSFTSTWSDGTGDHYVCIEIAGTTSHAGGDPIQLELWSFGTSTPDTSRANWDTAATEKWCACDTGVCSNCDNEDNNDSWGTYLSGTFVGVYSGGAGAATSFDNFCAGDTGTPISGTICPGY